MAACFTTVICGAGLLSQPKTIFSQSMKLHLPLLTNLIDLPARDARSVQRLLDDLGLEVKGLDESLGHPVFNIETLANRGDHLSALGVAREISARLLTPIHYPKLGPEFSGLSSPLPISVKTDLCTRCALLEVRHSGARPFSLLPDITACFGDRGHPDTPIVDLLNYLQLEVGHPTHAFDLDKIEGEVVIDILDKEEKILALDGKEYLVPAGAVVHRDKKKVIDVAGVIGCANTMSTPTTKRYLVEAAAFEPVSIRKTARAMGISTDASYAFERGVDREAVLMVLRRLAALATGLGDDRLSTHGLYYFEGPKTESKSIRVRVDEVRRQFNLPKLSETEMHSRLKALGYLVSSDEDKSSFNVQVPSWRVWDSGDEADVIEDLARSMSFSQVKCSLPALDYSPPSPTAQESTQTQLENVFQGLGFREVMTKNLYSNEEVVLLEQLDPSIRTAHVPIKNAIEKSCSHLKVTNLIHLGRSFENNLKRGVTSFKVYECARLFKENFVPNGHPYERELDVMTVALGGRIREGEWRKPESAEENFYWLKGSLETAFHTLKVVPRFESSNEKLLHPGRQAALHAEGKRVGIFGQMHPKLAASLEMKLPLFYAEVDLFLLSEIASQQVAQLREPSDFPEVERDLTLKVGANTLAGHVLDIIRASSIDEIARSEIVDDFRRKDENFRRVSVRIVFQSDTRTLTSSEVDSAMAKIQENLNTKGFELAT